MDIESIHNDLEEFLTGHRTGGIPEPEGEEAPMHDGNPSPSLHHEGEGEKKNQEQMIHKILQVMVMMVMMMMMAWTSSIEC